MPRRAPSGHIHRYRSIGHITLLALAAAALGCNSGPTIAEAFTAQPPPCATGCVDGAQPGADDVACIRDACAPSGEPLSAGVTWRGLGADEGDPAARRDDLTAGDGPTMAPVARFMVRAVQTDALYGALVDAWYRCRNRVFHRAEAPADWQIRFYAAERDLLAKWSWLDSRVVFFGAVDAGSDDEGRAVWELPGEMNPDSPNHLSQSEAEAMVHDLLAVDVCGG